MPQVQFFTVSEDEDGQRIDNYLMSRLKGVPRTAVYRIVRKGEVRINKGRVKPDRRVREGDIVRVPPMAIAALAESPKPSHALAAALDGAILHDQNGLVVVNKPAGIAVHGGSGVNLGLVEALRQMPRFKGFLELVHRLDRDTSGCVMLARKRSVLMSLQQQLREREGIDKVYLALAQGDWPAHLPFVDVPLKRLLLPSNERIVKVHVDGKPSLTRFKVLARAEGVTLLEARPITGRTHQIRVHAKHVGHPLVGDEKYADNVANKELAKLVGNRLFLHAYRLQMVLEGVAWDFTAELPQPLLQGLARLGFEVDKVLSR